MQGRFDALCQRIETGFATVPQAQGLADIDAAIAAERQAMQKPAPGTSAITRKAN